MVLSPALSATMVSTHRFGRNTFRTLLMIDLFDSSGAGAVEVDVVFQNTGDDCIFFHGHVCAAVDIRFLLHDPRVLLGKEYQLVVGIPATRLTCSPSTLAK